MNRAKKGLKRERMYPKTIDGAPLPVEGRVYIAGPGMLDLVNGSLAWMEGRRVIVRRIDVIEERKGTQPARIVELMEVRVLTRGHRVQRELLGTWDGIPVEK